jgi:PEGA domain
MPLAAGLFWCLGLGGCLFQRSQPGLLIATHPPGARLFVDGADSGFVTPAWIEVPSNDWHRLDVSLPGYEPQSRLVSPHKRVHAIPWTKGWIGVHTWWFPLLLPAEDFFFPVRVDDSLAPKRLHIQLNLAD